MLILNELVRGQVDEWDRLRVMEFALEGLRLGATSLRDAEPFRRLQTALVERGILDARDL